MRFEQWLKKQQESGNYVLIVGNEEIFEAMRAAWQAGYEEGCNDGYDQAVNDN